MPVKQPDLHAGRNRQARDGLSRRPVFGPARGAGSRTELLLLRPLPGGAFRPVEGYVHCHSEHPRADSAGTEGQDGGPRTPGIHRGREDPHRDQVPHPQADRGARPRKLTDQDQERCTAGNHQLLHTGGGCSKRGTGGGLHLQGCGQGGGGGPNRSGGHHETRPS